MSIADGPLWLVGCGNMGGAMLARWLAAGLDPAEITVFTRHPREMPDGVRHLTVPPPDEVPAILVLAVKPQQLPDAAVMFGHLASAMLVSILAGVEEASLAAHFPDAHAIVRAMPNLPVAIGRGVVALHGGGDAAKPGATRLMQPLGLVEWVADEAQFDAVTALAGCGPGFVFRFVDALAVAGEALGLPHDQAQRLAVATLAGAGAMAAEADVSPATLADRVASPGGSTREGLDVLDRDDALATLIRATLAASARRNAEMAIAARR